MSKKQDRRKRRDTRKSTPPILKQVEPIAPQTDTKSPTQLTQLKARFSERHFSGPIPPPELLREYDAIHPGFADRIMSMAEQQSAHRRALESAALEHEHKRSYAGLACGLLVAMTSIIGGCVVAVHGYTFAGSTIATTSVVGLVGVFVYGKRATVKERQAKAELMVKGK